MGRADEAPEDGPVPVAAGGGGHGQGPGGVQTLQSHGPRVLSERTGGGHLTGPGKQLQVGAWPVDLKTIEANSLNVLCLFPCTVHLG